MRKYVLYQLIGTSCLLYMVFRCILVLMDNNIIDLDGTVLPWLPSDTELPWILIDNDVHIVIQIVGFLTTVTSKCILSQKYRYVCFKKKLFLIVHLTPPMLKKFGISLGQSKNIKSPTPHHSSVDSKQICLVKKMLLFQKKN